MGTRTPNLKVRSLARYPFAPYRRGSPYRYVLSLFALYKNRKKIKNNHWLVFKINININK